MNEINSFLPQVAFVHVVSSQKQRMNYYRILVAKREKNRCEGLFVVLVFCSCYFVNFESNVLNNVSGIAHF